MTGRYEIDVQVISWRACLRACVRACVRACERASVRAGAGVGEGERRSAMGIMDPSQIIVRSLIGNRIGYRLTRSPPLSGQHYRVPEITRIREISIETLRLQPILVC